MNIQTIADTVINNFPTYYVLMGLTFFLALFLVWSEGRKDGFERERLYDLFFLSTLWLVALYFIIDYYSLTSSFLIQYSLIILLYAGLVGILGLIKIQTMRWKWSIYRVLDIFTLYFFLSITFFITHNILLTNDYQKFIYLGLFFAIYLPIYLLRNKLFSGLLFSIFLILIPIFGQFFYQSQSYLIFYFILITISMVNLIFRTRRNMMARKLSEDFLNKIKEMLNLKKKRLQAEQQRLIDEDPYLQEGRDVDNSEEIDEAILEDRAKVESDIKKENIEGMQEQVDKALEQMDKGEYGICEVCGEAIDKARLEVYPEATRCVDHANK